MSSALLLCSLPLSLSLSLSLFPSKNSSKTLGTFGNERSLIFVVLDLQSPLVLFECGLGANVFSWLQLSEGHLSLLQSDGQSYFGYGSTSPRLQALLAKMKTDLTGPPAERWGWVLCPNECLTLNEGWRSSQIVLGTAMGTALREKVNGSPTPLMANFKKWCHSFSFQCVYLSCSNIRVFAHLIIDDTRWPRELDWLYGKALVFSWATSF